MTDANASCLSLHADESRNYYTESEAPAADLATPVQHVHQGKADTAVSMTSQAIAQSVAACLLVLHEQMPECRWQTSQPVLAAASE